ncbi:hypothetical protein LC76P1_00066 [Lysinibacillus phage LC76P1]|nr:hypothetical protein LC76P1_00066 [Lysinibacillus phage LC76P1]
MGKLFKVLTITAQSENELDDLINNAIVYHNNHEVEVGNLSVYRTGDGYMHSHKFTVMLKIYHSV